MPIQRVPWQIYNAAFKGIHDLVFSHRDLDQRPFARADWSVLPLVGGLTLEDELLDAFGQAANSVGDVTVVAISRGPQFPAETPWELTISRDALEELRCSTTLGHSDCDLFGTRGCWGFAVSVEGFGLVSGLPEFLNVLVNAVPGGSVRLITEFRKAADGGELAYGEAGREYLKRVMNLWSGPATR